MQAGLFKMSFTVELLCMPATPVDYLKKKNNNNCTKAVSSTAECESNKAENMITPAVIVVCEDINDLYELHRPHIPRRCA